MSSLSRLAIGLPALSAYGLMRMATPSPYTWSASVQYEECFMAYLGLAINIEVGENGMGKRSRCRGQGRKENGLSLHIDSLEE